MTNINQLSSMDTLSGGDLLAVWAQNNGDTRKSSLTLLTSYLQGVLVQPGSLTTQYAAPSATGFAVTVATGDTWLILTPTGTLAVGAIILPSAPTDKAEVIVTCTQIVTALTVSAGGTTVTGAPTTLAANQGFTMRFDAATNAWYRDNSIENITAFAQSLLNDPDAATARTTLGATTVGSSVFTASTAATARTALGAGAIGGNVFIAATAAAAQQAMDTEVGVDVQAFDADLSALAGLAANGMISRTGAGTASVRTITAGAGISIANGDGVAGNPTITSTDVLQGLIATDIAAIANAINTTGKAAGKMIWDTTNTKIKVATGALAADTWVDADGTNAVTPA
jgi:hypothetical protein